ncbi:MAG TPA: glycosyltransferase family 4 protein [Thermoanaerobaculia bacterium]|jgi:glycosyltransferase involved in cell wall biosynthesis
MHVAVVCRALGIPGGVANSALRQARELSRHARVTLLSDVLPSDVAPLDGVRVGVPDLHALRRFRHAPDEYLFARAARAALFALHERERIDFVLCHAHTTTVVAGLPFRARTGVPVGMFLHGDIRLRPKGTYDARVTALYRYMTPRAYRAADVVFAPAESFAALAVRSGARESAIELLPNGVDPAELGLTGDEPPLPPRAAGEPLRMLYVGRLAIEKGADVLLRACARLTVPFTLDVIGSGPLEARLREEAMPQVRFLGVQPRPALGALYREHHLLVLPSLTEAFPLVLAEAMVSGLPVVATDVGAVADVVDEGVNGIIVPPGDEASLAAAIERLGRDEAERVRLAANARASVWPRLAWGAVGDRLAARIARAVSGAK